MPTLRPWSWQRRCSGGGAEDASRRAGAGEADGPTSAQHGSPACPHGRDPAGRRGGRAVRLRGPLAHRSRRPRPGRLFEDWVFNGLLLRAPRCACCARRGRAGARRLDGARRRAGLLGARRGRLHARSRARSPPARSPRTSDFLWLVFYPAAFLTLGLLVRARVRQFYPSLWLDGVVGALAVAALASQFVLPRDRRRHRRLAEQSWSATSSIRSGTCCCSASSSACSR